MTLSILELGDGVFDVLATAGITNSFDDFDQIIDRGSRIQERKRH